MKITKKQLKAIIKEELNVLLEIDAAEEMKSRIATSQAERGFEPSPTGTPSPEEFDPLSPPETIGPPSSSVSIDALWRDLRVLLENWPDRDHQYYQDLRNLMEDYSTGSGEPEDDDPGFMLGQPKEDPMGRGNRTSALRRSVMRK
jgi:hypothetical protein